MKTKAQVRRDALDQWWSRQWPCVVLGVDPGKEAGAAIVESVPGAIRLVCAEEVDSYSRDVEEMIARAVSVSQAGKLPLVMALEKWGTGGPLGIEQWIGLGEQSGVWKRAFILVSHGIGSVRRGNVVRIHQRTWRSRIIPEAGVQDPGGKWKAYSTEEWKAAAAAAAADLFIHSHVPVTPNAAEAACIGYFAARSDQVGAKMTKTWLRKHAMEYGPLEPLINPKRKKR